MSGVGLRSHLVLAFLAVHLKEEPRGCQRGEVPGRKGDHSPIPDLETVEKQLVTARRPALLLPWPWEEGLLQPNPHTARLPPTHAGPV